MKRKRQPDLPHAIRSLGAVVAVVLEELPRDQWTTRTICDAVKHRASASEWLQWGDLHLVQGVRSALRAREPGGMPVAPSIGGVRHDPEQLTFPQYVTWAYEMAIRGIEMEGRARQIALLCQERLGRTFDADAVIHAAHSGEPIDVVLERLTA